MLRRSTALTLVALVPSALLAATPATAAAETCQDRPATIVGTGYEVTGTAGDDVIVTGASGVIRAGAGDDLVCVRQDAYVSIVSVDAGPGNDVVDASASLDAFEMTTRLGTGLDRYVGATHDDRVLADGADDRVSGAHYATLEITGPATGPTGSYDARSIEVLSVDMSVEVDLGRQGVLVDGTHAADLVHTDPVAVRAVAPQVTLRGTSADDALAGAGCDVHIVGKGGNDSLSTRLISYYGDNPPRFACEGVSTLRGGPGDDSLHGSTMRDRLFGGAGRDWFVGKNGADLLVGGAGRDELSGARGPDVIRGNAGDDTMTGGSDRDIVLGNRGHDVANGEAGSDRCVAERERRCER